MIQLVFRTNTNNTKHRTSQDIQNNNKHTIIIKFTVYKLYNYIYTYDQYCKECDVNGQVVTVVVDRPQCEREVSRHLSPRHFALPFDVCFPDICPPRHLPPPTFALPRKIIKTVEV